jgi:hypothetical protein
MITVGLGFGVVDLSTSVSTRIRAFPSHSQRENDHAGACR